jgi:glycosyltransferase involved in cell wall biosynthesis
MRVAILTASARAGDAVGNQVAEKVSFFRERGGDVRVFADSLDCPHPTLAGCCQRLDADRPVGSSWDYLSACDLLIVEYSQFYPLLLVLPLLAGGKPRVLFDYHGVTPPAMWGPHQREPIEQGVRRRGLVWCADAAIAHSRFAERELSAATGFPAERLFTLPHPVDTRQFCPATPRIDLRVRLGLGPATILLFVGRVAPNKRVPVLVQALARLHHLVPPVHAIIIGATDDVYALEAERCRREAARLGVGDRLHFLGRVDDADLLDAYRSADVFVMPSAHEGFCIPVVEAMACGAPVVAARAGALPEVVASAGLTFRPEDDEDLASRVERVLSVDAPRENQPSMPLRVAVVTHRYGDGFVGGAETALRTMAIALHRAGHAVEVFTTCALGDDRWTNDLPAGTSERDGIPLHRFPIDPHDPERLAEAVRWLSEGDTSAETEAAYLRHTLHSKPLIEALHDRAGEYDAILTGPYAKGLAHDAAVHFPDKTVLVPCYHDEPLAHLAAWPRVYGRIGAMAFLSPEEQAQAEADGWNCPGSACVGGCIDTLEQGDTQHARRRIGTDQRYLVYCGRYLEEKRLPVLLEYARRYAVQDPQRFRFVFMGQGSVPIPRAPWALDLGFVDVATRRNVVAGADALLQLSRLESLSLVALEAWAQGVPVIADRGCAVLAAQVARSSAGALIESYEEFAQCLDELWHNPQTWRARGARGRDYVTSRHGSHAAHAERLEALIRQLALPPKERMRRAGLTRAADLARPGWRASFGALVDHLLHPGARAHREQVSIEPRSNTSRVCVGVAETLVAVRITNHGTHAQIGEGPGRLLLGAAVESIDMAPGRATIYTGEPRPLPDLLMPDQSLAMALPVPVPDVPGAYRVRLRALRHGAGSEAAASLREGVCGGGQLTLMVEREPSAGSGGCFRPLLDALDAELLQADRLRTLPDDYFDVSTGRLAGMKHWLKAKLLGNFKRGYVDVLSRQQSAFNHRVLQAMQELRECWATLVTAPRHVLQSGETSSPSHPVHELLERLKDMERHNSELRERIARLETMLQEERSAERNRR